MLAAWRTKANGRTDSSSSIKAPIEPSSSRDSGASPPYRRFAAKQIPTNFATAPQFARSGTVKKRPPAGSTLPRVNRLNWKREAALELGDQPMGVLVSGALTDRCSVGSVG